MSFEDSPSDGHFPANPLLLPLLPQPAREPFGLLLLGILLFALLMVFTWVRGASRTPPVSYTTTSSARLETYQVEFWCYQQAQGGKLAASVDGQVAASAKRVGNAWRDISNTVVQADAQARRQQQSPLYGNEYAAHTAINAAALYGIAGNLPLARTTIQQAMVRDPAQAGVYRQLLALYQPAATSIVFSPPTEQLLHRLSTGPLLRARNAQLTANKSAVLAALRPGAHAGMRALVIEGGVSLLIGAVTLTVIILGIVYWPQIARTLREVTVSAADTPPWGIGAALIAISVLFLLSSLLSALLVRLLHIRHDNYQLILPIGGAVEIICAGIVFSVFLALHGRHPLDWSVLGWHAARKRIGYGVATLFFCYPLVMLCSWISQSILKDKSDNPLLTSLECTVNPWTVLALFLMAAVMAPLVEETLFRGMLFRALGARMPFWGAAIISGVLFAVGHGELVVVLPITLLGIAFAFLYRHTDNLWPSAAAHGVFNTLATLTVLLNAWAMRGPGS